MSADQTLCYSWKLGASAAEMSCLAWHQEQVNLPLVSVLDRQTFPAPHCQAPYPHPWSWGCQASDGASPGPIYLPNGGPSCSSLWKWNSYTPFLSYKDVVSFQPHKEKKNVKTLQHYLKQFVFRHDSWAELFTLYDNNNNTTFVYLLCTVYLF